MFRAEFATKFRSASIAEFCSDASMTCLAFDACNYGFLVLHEVHVIFRVTRLFQVFCSFPFLRMNQVFQNNNLSCVFRVLYEFLACILQAFISPLHFIILSLQTRLIQICSVVQHCAILEFLISREFSTIVLEDFHQVLQFR